VLPGETRTASFSVRPISDTLKNATFGVTANVYAKRVVDNRSIESLIGTAKAEGSYSSVVALDRELGHISGPVPPRVGERTTYKVTVVTEAGVNGVTDAMFTSSLPQYVEWVGNASGDGTLTYNPVSKQLSWNVGDVAGGARAQHSFSVSILPSTSQVGTTPVLLNAQRVRANDSFTSALLQDDNEALKAELSTELGFSRESGRVQAAD
jgi:hypothetical protein